MRSAVRRKFVERGRVGTKRAKALKEGERPVPLRSEAPLLYCERLGNYFVVQGNGTFPLLGTEPVRAPLSIAHFPLLITPK